MVGLCNLVGVGIGPLSKKLAVKSIWRCKWIFYLQQLYKNFKKDCPDGELSRNKFYEMYIASFPGKNADEFIDHAFKTFDTDGSGYIDFKEFILAIDSITTGKTTM